MANYILQEMPIRQEDGKKRVYPRIQVYSRFDYEQVLERMSGYPGSPGKGALMSAFDMLRQMLVASLPEGHTIKIDGLGTFSLSLEFDDQKPNEKMSDEDNMAYRHVRIKDVNFKVEPDLLLALNKNAEFTRSELGVRSPSKPSCDREKRIEKAFYHIGKYGFLSLADYVNITGLSRTAASRELRSFEEMTDVPIKGSGVPPHKVWVKE